MSSRKLLATTLLGLAFSMAPCAATPLPTDDPTVSVSVARVLAGQRYIGLCGDHPILVDFKKSPTGTLLVDFYTSSKQEFARQIVTSTKGLGSRKNFPVIVSGSTSAARLDVAHSGGVYTFQYTAGLSRLDGACGDTNDSKPWPMSVNLTKK